MNKKNLFFKRFTLIELVIVIVVIGILVGMALPKFTGVIHDAKVSAMFKDEETLEKSISMYYLDNNEYPLYRLDENNFNITNSLLDTLHKNSDNVSKLKVIDKSKLKNYLNKDTKYGKNITEDDEYLYSELTGNVYYAGGLQNGKGITYHIYDSTPSIYQPTFIKSLGGESDDEFIDIKETSDGGYIAIGYTISTTGDFEASKGATDSLIVKFNKNSEIEWKKTLGGTNYEDFRSVIQTTDGGYIAVGYTNSINGDFNISKNGADALIVKFDEKGNMLWNKVLGGTNKDRLYSVDRTFDGGYIAAGYTMSTNGDFPSSKGEEDALLVKFNSEGIIEWSKVINGDKNDNFYNVKSTLDGGYIAVGYNSSTIGDLNSTNGNMDSSIVKFNSKGDIEWKQNIGGSGDDYFKSVIETNNDTYIAVGNTNSNDKDFIKSEGYKNCTLIEFDNKGNIINSNFYGGSGYEEFTSIRRTNDNGFIVVGSINSTGGDFGVSKGSDDALIVKYNQNKKIEWYKSIGGSSLDFFTGVVPTLDNGFVTVGHTKSNNGDFSGNKGSYDAMIVKFNSLGEIE